MTKLEHIKKALDIGNADLSKVFGLQNTAGFRNSTAYPRYAAAVVALYELIVPQQARPYRVCWSCHATAPRQAPCPACGAEILSPEEHREVFFRAVTRQLLETVEIPKEQVDSERTIAEMTTCYERGYNVPQAVNYITWGTEPPPPPKKRGRPRKK
jgi:hypothetical protein